MIALLLEATLRSLAFAGAAGLMLWLFRVRDAGARLAAWTAVLYGLFLIPIAATWMPRMYKPVMSAPAVVLKIPASLKRVAARPDTPRRRIDPVASGFAAIAILLLARLGYGLYLTRRLRRSANAVEDPRLLAMLDELSRAAGMKRIPSITQSDALAVPVTVGCFSPAIILPANWKSWDRSKLSAVLAHELSHVRRADYRTLLFATVYRCLCWFNPLAWWLDRHLRELAEQASDDTALHITQDKTRYAEVLLDFLEAAQDWRGRLQQQGVGMFSGERAGRRIDRILTANVSLSIPSGRRVLLSVALAAAPLLYLSAALQPAAIAQTSPKQGDKLESYVIISGDSTTMNGSIQDLQRALGFRAKLGDDFMWFRRHGKSNVIRDPETLGEARRIVSASLAPATSADELAEEQLRAMENEREGLAQQMRRLKELKEEHSTSSSPDELAEVKAQLQGLEAQSAEQKAKSDDLLRQLKVEQAHLSKDHAGRAREHMLQLQELIDRAAENGLVEPEPR
jgi:beta-lactamase regulating signal transducer with metallopeptidase domain